MPKSDAPAPQISSVFGLLVRATGMEKATMFEVVRVGAERLVGEVIRLDGGEAAIQVYEDTTGLKPGDPVELTGASISVTLGPGLLESIYDGVQRPLAQIEDASGGPFIARGIEVPALDETKKWKFTPNAALKIGAELEAGALLGTVFENESFSEHKILLAPGKSGKLESLASAGDFTILEEIAKVGGQPVRLAQEWPIRRPRPAAKKLKPTEPLHTGIRILDTMFPVAKGGTGSTPGPFGAGKTVTQQWIAKQGDADVVVYIGCGERGNEMTDILVEFPEQKDQHTGRPLMERTVVIANTSNMPVAAREASIYTGMTIAEYFRDQGLDVALMADSTSRWAEAMREISSRLEEMPGDEGYPPYLASKVAQFYERAGLVETLAGKKGSVTALGAVSPAGGDMSDPVVQATMRVTKAFWALDADLAYQRHYPAINWLQSYTLYFDQLGDFFRENVAEDFQTLRNRALELLADESRLAEIVKLVGMDSLAPADRLTLETAKNLRERFLYQNAFNDADIYQTLRKQRELLNFILSIDSAARELLGDEDRFAKFLKADAYAGVEDLRGLPDKGDFEKYAEITEKAVAAVARI